MNLTTVNEIRASALPLQEQIEEMIGMITDRIRDEAHPGGNMDWLQHCAKTVESLQQDLKTLEAIREHAVEVLKDTLSFQSDEMAISKSGMRTLRIEVSQGMINQHLLTLTDAKARGLVKAGEKFTITLPDGTSFSTELCDPGNKLRERGQIRKFYESAKIVEGDKVILAEISRGNWSLHPENTPEGQIAGAPFQLHYQDGANPKKGE